MTEHRNATSLPAAIAWALVFATVVSHLPAVGFDFAQDDFASLARAADPAAAPTPGARAWSTTVPWTVLWPLFGNDPSPYHGLSLLLLAAIAWLTARIATRLDAGPAGATLAGLLVLLGPSTALPIAWVSAANELWAALFALAALDRWLAGGRGRDAVLATLLALLSFHSKESALGLGVAFLLADRWMPPAVDAGMRRARTLLAVVAVLGAAHAGLRVVQAFRPAADGAYAVAGPVDAAAHLLRVLGWALWPASGGVPGDVVATGLGGVVALGAVLWVLRSDPARRGVPLLLALGLLAAALPPALIGRGPEPYHALFPSVLVALGIGRAVGPWMARRLRAGTPTRVLAAAATIVVTLVAGFGVDARVHARGDDGQLVHPVLRRSAVVNGVRQQLDAVRAARPTPTAVGIVQATRMAGVDSVATDGAAPIFLGSPVFVALQGNQGLRVLAPTDPEALWITHVDEMPDGGFVFLDPGDAFLRPLGPPSNARIYTALIAVAAGQFQRARHDLWNVIRDQGVRVRFAFDPANLPIRPDELDAEAAAFAHYLERTAGQDGTAVDVRILRLFEQVYEQVRGEELIRDLDGFDPLRAPRFDD